MILSHHARSATGTTIGKHNKKWETSMKWPLRHLYEMLRKASWGTIKVFFFPTFHFSLLFPVLFPRCASLLYSPLHYPVVGSKSSSQSLKKWWLRTCAHLQKKHKNLWFSIFSFDLYTDSILKQVNKLKILKKVLGCNVLYFNLMQYMYVRSDDLGLVPLWWQTISKSFACMYCTVM